MVAARCHIVTLAPILNHTHNTYMHPHDCPANDSKIHPHDMLHMVLLAVIVSVIAENVPVNGGHYREDTRLPTGLAGWATYPSPLKTQSS